MTSMLAGTMSMDEVMRTWPQTIRVVLDHRMHCVGCPIARFQTLSDACKEHGVDEAQFLEDVRRVLGVG